MTNLPVLPVYELSGAFSWDEPPYDPLLKIGVTEQQMLGLAFIRNIRETVIGRDFSFICTLDGRHRSGKSTMAILVSSLLDKTFMENFKMRVVYTPNQLLAAIQDLDAKGIRGGCIVVDEAGVSLSADSYFESFSKVLAKVFNVFGYLNPVVFLCLPISSDVLAKVRRLNHAYWSCSRYSKEFSVITPYDLKFNSVYQKTFFKKPVILIGGRQVHLKRVVIGKPPEWLIAKYQELSLIQKPLAIKELADQFKATELKSVKKTLDIEQLIDAVMKDQKNYLAKRSTPDNPNIDTTAVRFRLKVPNEMAKHIKGEVERRLMSKTKEGTI